MHGCMAAWLQAALLQVARLHGCTAAGLQAAGCRGGSADSYGIARKAKTNEKQAKTTKTQEKGI
jgi:hypothetical protein